MKKEDKPTIEALFEEYKERKNQAKAEADTVRQTLAEDDKRIAALESKVNASVSGLSEEEYIANVRALENAKLAKQMHERQLKEKEGAGQGFATEAEKQAFKKQLEAAYAEDEAAFNAECEKQIQAIQKATKDRQPRLNMFTSMAPLVGMVMPASVERDFYTSTVSRYEQIKHAANLINGKK